MGSPFFLPTARTQTVLTMTGWPAEFTRVARALHREHDEIVAIPQQEHRLADSVWDRQAASAAVLPYLEGQDLLEIAVAVIDAAHGHAAPGGGA